MSNLIHLQKYCDGRNDGGGEGGGGVLLRRGAAISTRISCNIICKPTARMEEHMQSLQRKVKIPTFLLKKYLDHKHKNTMRIYTTPM